MSAAKRARPKDPCVVPIAENALGSSYIADRSASRRTPFVVVNGICIPTDVILSEGEPRLREPALRQVEGCARVEKPALNLSKVHLACPTATLPIVILSTAKDPLFCFCPNSCSPSLEPAEPALSDVEG
jgi:hypothetical protein